MGYELVSVMGKASANYYRPNPCHLDCCLSPDSAACYKDPCFVPVGSQSSHQYINSDIYTCLGGKKTILIMTDLFSLKDKVALVTGASRGIGAAIAEGLAEAGADIIMVQRNESPENKSKIESLGRKAYVLPVDMSNRKEVKQLIPKAIEVAGKLDILVNCAGIQKHHDSHKFEEEDWDNILEINLSSVFFLCQAAGKYFLEREADEAGTRGKIINIASLLTFQGGTQIPAYAASKGGVAQFTKTLSNEWAEKGICVNAIAPGYVATDMNKATLEDPEKSEQRLSRIPKNQWGKPEDFKGPAIFLASKASNYITGEIIMVDGGWMAR